MVTPPATTSISSSSFPELGVIVSVTVVSFTPLAGLAVFHVHDEVICEVPKDKAQERLEVIEKAFATPAPWAEGLPLKGAGYLTDFYLKD